MSTGKYAERVGKWIADGVDFPVAVAAGKYPGWSVIHKFGSNTSLGTSIEDIWSVGGLYAFPMLPFSVEVLSSSTDDVNLTGTGAWTVVLQGLDGDCVEISETINLNGTTAVAATNTYMRISRAYVMQSGTYRTGALGDITIRIGSGGAVQAEILRTSEDGTVWNYGQTQLGRYTVPLGKTAFVSRIAVHNESTKSADVVIYQHRDVGGVAAPFCTSRIFKSFSGVDGHAEIVYKSPQKFPALTDIYARARLTSGSAGKISIDMEICLYDGVL